MEVKLFKQNVDYVTNAGEKKNATNYFVQCGDVLVPVEVKYFEDKETKTDKNYRARRTLMSAFAEVLPQRNRQTEQVQQPHNVEKDPTA